MTAELTPWRGTCASCAAPIVWATTAGKKLMPVDAQPHPQGNVLLTVSPGSLNAGVLGRNQAAGARDRGQALHRSHFVTCPQAAQHRRVSRKRGGR